MRSKTKHIDDVQPSTVNEHFRALVTDEDTIDYETSEKLTPADLPEWYDEELFKAGQRYYSDNLLGISAAAMSGMVAVLAIPSVLNILIYTNKSGTPDAAFRRHLQATLMNRLYHTSDPKDKNSDWYKSINTIRLRHGNVSRRSLRDGLGGITQRDMALSQLVFMGYVLVNPECFGLTNTPKEREGFNHFWRVVGHTLGISDRLNVCRKSEAETTELCAKLIDQVIGKFFREVPPNFLDMTRVMVEGLWCVDMTMDMDAILAFTYKLNGLQYDKPLGLYSWLNLKYRETIHKLCATPYIGTTVRVYFNYFLNFNYWAVKNWPVVAWLKFGKEKSKIQL